MVHYNAVCSLKYKEMWWKYGGKQHRSRAFKAEPHSFAYNYMNHTVQKGTSKRQIKFKTEEIFSHRLLCSDKQLADVNLIWDQSKIELDDK